MPTIEEIVEGRGICICAGSGGVGKTTTSAALAAGLAARGQKVCVLTIDPAKRLADSLGLQELENTPRRVDPTLFERAGSEMRGELWAMKLDAKATFDELVRKHAPDAETPRPDPREPHLPPALQRPGGLPGVHGDGEALRDPPGGPLRLPRPRHAALAQRARLPRRAQAAHAVHRGPRHADVHEADRLRHQGGRPRQLDGVQRAEARHRPGPDLRPERVLPGLQRHGRRLPRARQARLRAARRPGDHLRRRLRPAGRADRRGRLLPPQAGRGEAARRRRDRQQGPLRGRRGGGGRGRDRPTRPARRRARRARRPELRRLPGAGRARREERRAPPRASSTRVR